MTRTRLLYQFLSCHSSEAAGSRAKCRFLDQRCGRGQGAQEAAFPVALSHPASSGQDSPQGGENSGGLRRWGAFRSPCFSGSPKSCLEALLVPHLCLSPTLTTTLSDSETCISYSGERSTRVVGSRCCFPRRESERWCCAGRGLGNPAQHHQPPCSWIPRLCPMNQLQVLVLWKYNFCSYDFILLN